MRHSEISEPRTLPGKAYRLIRLLMTVLALALGALGCTAQQDRLSRFNRLYTRGDWQGAQAFAKPQAASEKNLLWVLQRAMVERLRQDYRASNEWFDRAEDLMKGYETDFKGLDGVGSTLVNESTIPYRGEIYDGIMVNTYKALNFMALGQDDLARVEFNRALDRQRRAKERFAREIRKLKEDVAKDKTSKKVNIQKTVNDPNTESRIRRQYSNLYEFEAYPDFTNPFTTYLAGLFFTLIEDPGKAMDLLKESTGMVPDNRTIAQDFEAVDRWLGVGRAPAPSVWVVFENGLGPVKQEFRVDIPLFLVTDDILYTGIALPRLSLRERAFPSLEVKSGETWELTEVAGQMDRVIQTEFAKDFPGILTRTIISAVAKGAVQKVLLKQDNPGSQLLGLMAAAYNAATTVADLRLWTSLPKEFQVARIPMPGDNQVQLRWGGGQTLTVPIDPCRYALVYVKIITPGTPPVVQVVTRGKIE